MVGVPRRLPAAGWGQLLSVCRLRSRRHWKGIRTLGAITGWRAEPEAKLRFDNFAGEPRNSDIAATCRDPNGDYLLAVEAKADESFGETIERSLAAALERRIANNRSNALSRIQQLTEALFEPKRKGEPKLGTLRYQLLTACAGALCEAERLGFDRALMLVQEFVTDETDDRKEDRYPAGKCKVHLATLCGCQLCARTPFFVPHSLGYEGGHTPPTRHLPDH